MLDSADLKQALKVTNRYDNRYDNRYERAADAVAALVGKSVVLNAIPKLSDIPEKTEELVRRKHTARLVRVQHGPPSLNMLSW